VGFRTTNDWSNCTSHLRWLQPRTEFPAVLLLSQPPPGIVKQKRGHLLFLFEKTTSFFWLWISEPKIQRHILSILHSIWNQKWKSPTPAWTPDDRKTAIWACKEVSSYDGVPRSNVMSIPKSYVKMAGTSGVVIDPKRNFDWPEGVFLAKKRKSFALTTLLGDLGVCPYPPKIEDTFYQHKDSRIWIYVYSPFVDAWKPALSVKPSG
jgi:hypothetical protein